MQTRFLGSMTLIAALALAAIAAPRPAQAHDGGAIAAGVIGGIAVGAIVGSQMNGGYYGRQGYYGGPGYYQSGYQPVYGRCHTERQHMQDGYGRVYTQRVRVCD